jgi:hypothetical protein
VSLIDEPADRIKGRDQILDAWGAHWGATHNEETGGWTMPYRGVWPSESFLWLALRLVDVEVILGTIEDLRGDGGPKSLSGFYHRVVDAVRIIERQGR